MFFSRFLKRKPENDFDNMEGIVDQTPPVELNIEGKSFPLKNHIEWSNNFPAFQWAEIGQWIEAEASDIDKASSDVHRIWLIYMRYALGQKYRLFETEHSFIISPQTDRGLNLTANFILRTRKRISQVLAGMAEFDKYNKSALFVMDDNDAYYDYVSIYETDDKPLSAGIFIKYPYPHFVVRDGQLDLVEPVMVHELTHSAVNHLSLPLWVDEGLAVNTEHRIAGKPPPEFEPKVMYQKHQQYWNEGTIQDFWCGKSFRETGDRMTLSYDLARILVEHLAGDWQAFTKFINHAGYEDGGKSAAMEYCGIDLGISVAAFLDKEGEYQPLPEKWDRLELDHVLARIAPATGKTAKLNIPNHTL